MSSSCLSMQQSSHSISIPSEHKRRRRRRGIKSPTDATTGVSVGRFTAALQVGGNGDISGG